MKSQAKFAVIVAQRRKIQHWIMEGTDRLSRRQLQHSHFVSTAQQLVPQALQSYGFAVDPLHVQPITFVNNATFKVESSLPGDDAQPFVLRIHRPGERSAETIAGELHWLLAIRQQTKLRVPYPRRTLTGELVGSIVPPRSSQPFYYVLFEWMEGQFLPTKAQNFELAYQVGCFIGALHQHSQRFSPMYQGCRRHLDGNSMFDWEALRLLWHQTLLSAEHLTLFEQVQHKVREIFHRLGRTSNVFGLVHADLIWKNYFFHEQGVGAVDFESCGWGYYLYDLAPTLLGYRDEPHAVELYNGLLAGYRTMHSMPHEHELYLPLLIAARHIVLGFR
jgi:Ser/Thr protein kinase RdoA (MazF antagonist)